MKNLIIVANWKENKTKEEALDWFSKLKEEKIDLSEKEVIICPPFTLLAKAVYLVSENGLKLKIGAQDVSEFELGAYTGEVSAAQVKEFASYVIVGHSERREHFNESDEILSKKVKAAITAGIIPIFCVPSENSKIPEDVKIVAFEPLSAIGTGDAYTSEDAQKIAAQIKSNNPNVEKVLYGGSVTSANVNQFTKMENIDGVLVGGASLSPHEFSGIVKNA